MINMKLERNTDVFKDVVDGYSYAAVSENYLISRTRVMEIFWRILQLIINKFFGGIALPTINDVRKSACYWVAQCNRFIAAS